MLVVTMMTLVQEAQAEADKSQKALQAKDKELQKALKDAKVTVLSVCLLEASA